MSVLPRRFKKIKSVLNKRIQNLTVLVEGVSKPHNLSAILRTCDAAGVFQANFICDKIEVKTFNSTAQGSQKWVKLINHSSSIDAAKTLKRKGFKLFGTTLNQKSIDYRKLDFTQNTCFVLGAEKWGLSEELIKEVDECIYIPMYGMVQSLNVSVAASILLYEAVRQRDQKGLLPKNGEGIDTQEYQNTLFEWAYPEKRDSFEENDYGYPPINENGEILNSFLS